MNINDGLLCRVMGDNDRRVGDKSKRQERGDIGSFGAESRVFEAEANTRLCVMVWQWLRRA